MEMSHKQPLGVLWQAHDDRQCAAGVLAMDGNLARLGCAVESLPQGLWDGVARTRVAAISSPAT
jgi:hypothetical protein